MLTIFYSTDFPVPESDRKTDLNQYYNNTKIVKATLEIVNMV